MAVFAHMHALIKPPWGDPSLVTIRQDGAVRLQLDDQYRTGPTIIFDPEDWDRIVALVEQARSNKARA